MKLVRIEHNRCGEWSATTHLLAPDHITEEQLEQDAEKAMAAFLKVRDEFEKAGKRPKLHMSQTIDKFPDHMTIAEAKEVVASHRQKCDEWSEKRKAAVRSFGEHMTDLGYTRIPMAEGIMSATISWGHRHGEYLDYIDDTLNPSIELGDGKDPLKLKGKV